MIETTMSPEKPSGITDIIPYPQGLIKQLVRLPMIFHQLGLGVLLRPMRLMALTTKGRKSGLARHTILEYRRHGSKLYVISGWGNRPHWVKNLQQNPAVTIQFGQKEIAANASIVSDSAEALRALYMFHRTGPVYEAILANMSNAESIDLRTLKLVADEFTVVRFDLTKSTAPLRGIRPVSAILPFAILGGLVLAIGFVVWMGFSRSQPTVPSAPSELDE
ncbi:MAG: nitroreductase family deazaflavin-dependent oxidoreductase [Chloroflexota bacterium]